MELQKSEHQPLGIRPQLISNQERFEIARQSEKIKDAVDEKIRQALRYAMVKIGLRAANFPEGIEKVLLVNHVYQTFPENTVEEIKLAFDWAIDDRLDLGDQGFNCFENFSCAYFSRIMKAYNVKANQVKVIDAVRVIESELKKETLPPSNYQEFLQSDFAERLRKNGINLPDDRPADD